MREEEVGRPLALRLWLSGDLIQHHSGVVFDAGDEGGAALAEDGEGERVEKLLAQADQNLYEEKARRKAVTKVHDPATRRRLKKS